MKKSFLLLLSAASLALAPADAQSIGRELPAAPKRTTLRIEITATAHDFTSGPYARYAQKYLAAPAPLADRTIHEIVTVEIQPVDAPRPEAKTTLGAKTRTSHMNPESGFPRLTVDRLTATPRTPEESAKAVASKIFDIRRNRYELITAQAGENVFGGGLKSALEELRRMEEEHLELFFGRQNSLSATKSYLVVPTAGEDIYTVCRFSEESGLLPADDLNGRPVLLELRVLDPSTEGLNIQDKPTSKSVPLRLPADVRCRILFDGAELASNIVRIEQFATTVNILP